MTVHSSMIHNTLKVKPKCPLTDKCINTICYIQATGYCSAVRKHDVQMFLMEIWVFHQIMRKACHRPIHRALWCGKVYSSGGLPVGFQCPSSICSAFEKNPTFSSANPKSSDYSFYFILKHSSLEPTWFAGPTWMLDTCVCVCSQVREKTNKRGEYGSLSKREKASVFHWGFISQVQERPKAFFQNNQSTS